MEFNPHSVESPLILTTPRTDSSTHLQQSLALYMTSMNALRAFRKDEEEPDVPMKERPTQQETLRTTKTLNARVEQGPFDANTPLPVQSYGHQITGNVISNFDQQRNNG